MFGILGAALAGVGVAAAGTSGAVDAALKNIKAEQEELCLEEALKTYDSTESKGRNEAADILVNLAQKRIATVEKLAVKSLRQHRLNRTKMLSDHFNRYVEQFMLIQNVNLKAVAGLEQFEGFPPYRVTFQILEKMGNRDLNTVENTALTAGKFNRVLNKAQGRYNKARAFDEQTKGFANAIYSSLQKLGQLELLLAKLEEYLGRSSIKLQQLFAESGKDWNNYNPEQKKLVASGVRLAETIRSILEAPILAEDGSFSRAAKEALLAGETILYELE